MPGSYHRATWLHNPIANAPPRFRRACRYDAFIPSTLAALELSIDAGTSGAVSDAETAIAALNAAAYPALVPLARLLLRTESIASSKVEGLQLGARELARAEAKAEGGRKISSTAVEIIGNINAMQLAIERAAAIPEFSVAQICDIHARLMAASTTPRIAGVVRTEQNWIGGNNYNPCGAEFVPPPPEYVAALLDDLCRAINDTILPPVVQAALVHAQFETIHPFHDGNGRTGRALIHVVLRRRGMTPAYVPPISVILAGDRDRYIRGLTDFRGDDYSAWIRQFADACAAAAQLAKAYAGAVDRLTQRWRLQLSSHASAPRRGAAAWALIDLLPAHPIITGPIAIASSGRAKSAVYDALEQLEQSGILARHGSSARNQVWECAELLDLIEGLEAGELPRG
ncbi:MAG: Fic family protein [Gemmatimonadaceae bacterium]|nr:Fic family protein [Gemmatimonadaceae bacterium]